MTKTLPCEDDPDIFFPPEKHNQNMFVYPDDAQDICNRCDVKVECLAHCLALENAHGHLEGVWGGLTPKERVLLQPPKRRKSHCWKGHPLTDANIRVYPSGERRCAICDRERQRKHNLKRREKAKVAV